LVFFTNQLEEAELVTRTDEQVLCDPTIATRHLTSRKSSGQSITAGHVVLQESAQNATTGVTLSTKSSESGSGLTLGNAHVISSSATTGLLDQSLISAALLVDPEEV
jgi:hypothetical protein